MKINRKPQKTVNLEIGDILVLKGKPLLVIKDKFINEYSNPIRTIDLKTGETHNGFSSIEHILREYEGLELEIIKSENVEITF